MLDFVVVTLLGDTTFNAERQAAIRADIAQISDFKHPNTGRPGTCYYNLTEAVVDWCKQHRTAQDAYRARGARSEAVRIAPNKRIKLMRRRCATLWTRCAHSLCAVRSPQPCALDIQRLETYAFPYVSGGPR